MLAIRPGETEQNDGRGWPGHRTWGTMRVAIGVSVLVLFLAAACGSDPTPTATSAPTPTPPPGATPTPMPTAQELFEQEWELLVAAAKEEGELVMSVGSLGDYRVLLERFQAEFGIQFKAQTGSGASLADRILAERQAGKKLVDIAMVSVAATSRRLAPTGSTISIPALLIDPDVTDLSNWHDGKFAFADWFVEGAGDTALIYAARVSDGYRFWYNTDKVSEEEADSITSLWDFINDPKWRGVLSDRSWHDPGRLGGMIRAYYMSDLGPEWITAYFEQGLVTFTDDERLVIDWVAKGQFPVQIAASGGPPSGDLFALQEAGLPLASRALPSAMGWMAARGSGCCIAPLEGGPNPNAQKLFVNWWLSKDVQTAVNAIGEPGRGITRSSLRNDVPQGNVHDDYMRVPGKQYVFRDVSPAFSGEEQEIARQFIVNTFLEQSGFIGEIRN